MAALIFFNLLLLIRWGLPEQAASTRRVLILSALTALAAGLVYEFNLGWILLVSSLLLIYWIAERLLPTRWLNATRLASLADSVIVLVVLTLLSGSLFGLQPRDAVTALPDLLAKYLGLLMGGLLLAQEANYLIRCVFRYFNLEPRRQRDTGTEQPAEYGNDTDVDTDEYRAGRLIGILERWIIYVVLVVSQNYNIIALIIAAKGFARFRQMDERPFAEYVLIGTLLSTLLTILVADFTLRAFD